ncbi:LANO_0C06084g1_1 [Lachancea nothofagi CBS 11611]|uniref:LANO_0C06084g1_1 n=1 Tax=Lachancea nothofagi CBS 11611 TaxID=1266666 RepID=A0A1G4J7Y7_9SACH|nr:LANO_0C06084g1_1 [Lachancea nothofagi CBS 11611]
MAKSHVVIQFGSKVICIGKCGEPEPLLTHFWSPEVAFNRVIMARLFHSWFQQPLMVKSTETDVLVVENVLLPIDKKRLICQVLLENLSVANVKFVPDVLMSLVAGGLRNGIVIDWGWEHLLATPVCDLRVLEREMQVSVKGCEKLCEEIYKLVDSDVKLETLLKQAWQDGERDETIEKVRHLIDQDFIGQGESECDFDLDEYPVIQMLRKIYESLALDIRKKLTKNVIVTGLPSWSPELRSRLQDLLPHDFRIVDTQGPWVGGSLYAELLITADALQPNKSDVRSTTEQVIKNDWHLRKFEYLKK